MLAQEICSILLLSIVATISAQSRILGGEEITVDKAPYVVQLHHKRDGFFCGGALVAPRYVVTAAHCLEGYQLTDIRVVAGATSLGDEGVQSRVEDGFMPAEYDVDTVDMDVAVLKLAEELRGGVVKTIGLCSELLEPGNLLQISGWGRVTENGDLSKNLRTVRVPLLPREECVLRYKRLGENLTKSMMCAFTENKDACTSDSGGPAVFGAELCGIVSWSFGCGHRQAPGIYTDINEVKWFIEQVMES
ncbi:trypsin alpha-3-like [Musca domestica]|uniref:Trypsin alpha-3-like n=1 Tax=Musca domestica TaxID=7370 RepID=A0A9J7DA74_MUSDO|nr:trypsin alpha-3-like [Musca domestica]